MIAQIELDDWEMLKKLNIKMIKIKKILIYTLNYDEVDSLKMYLHYNINRK